LSNVFEGERWSSLPLSERARRALEGLGLTGYEIKAYAALIEFGPMTAAEGSKRSSVPYSKIYDVLSNLEAKGWIEADRSRPSRFYPKSPETAVETTRMRRESERGRNEAAVLKELMPLYEKRGASELPEIWIVRGEFNILSKVKETLSACEKEVMIAVPVALDGLGPLMLPVLSELGQRGLKVMLMVTTGTEGELLRTLSRHAEVRLRDQLFGGGVIADGKQVVLLLGPEGGTESSLAIWADHPGLAKLARSYFGYLWNDSVAYPREGAAPVREAVAASSSRVGVVAREGGTG